MDWMKVIFVLSLLWTCRAVPLLLFANRKDIRLVDIEARRPNSSSVLISHLEDAAALDFYYAEGLIFWTDFGLEMIKGMYINNSKTERDIITTGLLSPDGLACDWLGKKLYWTDSDTNRIEVSNLDGSYRKVLFWKDLDQPRAIALVPMDGLMFWTDWGEMPKIERASMNGNHSTRKIIVKENIFWPNGLTIDYETKRIYWADAKLKFISGMDFDGHSRKVIVNRDLPHPFSLTLYHDRLYWTDWQTRTVQSCNKYDGHQKKNVIGGSLSPMGIHVYLNERQPNGPTPCDDDNGGCSHLCLMSSHKPYYSCACPTGVRLLDDAKTCADGPQEILLLARRTDIRRISLDTPDYTDVVLQLQGIRHTIAVDYDPEEHKIYWTDDETQMIRRAYLNGSEQEDLISTEVHHPDGIAIDWIARNLYWTDTGTDRIEVSRLNGTSRKILITENLDEPRAIVVDPVGGYMYWTDWGSNPMIERAELDGTERISIINTSLDWPNGLAIDYNNQKLYWGDAKLDKIEMANLDGSDRRVLVSDQLSHIFGFSLLGDYVYWTDWQQRSIERVHKITGDMRETIIDQLPDLMGLKAVNIYEKHGSNPCAIQNGNCSNLCLNKPEKKYICSCPMGLELASDLKTCIIPEAFLLFSRRSDIRRISLESKHDDIIPVSGILEASALDYDINDDRIYWTDIHLKTINRAFMNGSNVEHIIEFGLEYPEGMAVDWIAHNLYWTDMGSNRIEVSRLDGSSRKVLLWQDLDDPRSLALDPNDGYMYWSDWGSNPCIERSAMDGSDRSKIVTKIKRANGLTIDYIDRRIFWIDIDEDIIESADLTGGNRQHIIPTSLPDPYALTQYQDNIYWSDWSTRTIERASKITGENRIHIQKQLDFVVDIVVYHASRQSGWNPCAVNNGGCSHLCLALPSKSQHKSYNYCCACPSHYELASDNKTCFSPRNFILFSQKNIIGRMIPDMQNTPDIMLPISHLKNVRALEYDNIEKFIYWIDGRTQTIRRSYDNGTKMTVVVQNMNDLIHPFDMAIEPYSRSLYWSCAQNDVINVTKLNGKPIGIIISAEDQKPRHIVIHQNKGLIFWTNLVNPPRIESSSLDGSNKQIIIKDGLIQPGALAVDVMQNLIFWSDLNAKTIETVDINGYKRKTLVTGSLFQPVSLTVLGDYLYWIDKDQQVIERVSKLNGKNQHQVQYRMSHLTDIVAISPLDGNSSHPCFINNGGCSHLCITNGKGEKYCSCPIDLVLEKNEKSCINPPMCGPDQFRCQSGKMSCIPEAWRCDGFVECDDMLDELNCAECKSHQYKCKNNKCIDHKLVCDGIPNCPNGEDETCCQKDQYYCAALKKCINLSIVCQTEECSESLDEASLHCKQVVGLMKMETSFEAKANYTIGIVVAVLVLIVLAIWAYFCKRKSQEFDNDDTTDINMSSKPLNAPHKSQVSNPQPIIVPIHCSNNNSSNSICLGHMPNNCQIYDQNHVVGGSSTSSMDTPYPQETLNPPPSPVTVLSQCTEYCCSSHTRPSMRSYKYQRTWNQHPPPPTPCSTDVCDDSEPYSYRQLYYNIRLESSYDSDPYPPPPTPRSHYFSDDNCGTCPPSPSTVRSFYNPLPPPPSPVPESDS